MMNLETKREKWVCVCEKKKKDPETLHDCTVNVSNNCTDFFQDSNESFDTDYMTIWLLIEQLLFIQNFQMKQM